MRWNAFIRRGHDGCRYVVGFIYGGRRRLPFRLELTRDDVMRPKVGAHYRMRNGEICGPIERWNPILVIAPMTPRGAQKAGGPPHHTFDMAGESTWDSQFDLIKKTDAPRSTSSTEPTGSSAPSVDRFTPGPWTAHTFMVKAGHDKICQTGYSSSLGPHRSHEAAANARLIAAAPEMYAALDHVEAVLSIVMPRSHMKEYLETLDEVRAALAKASSPTERVELGERSNTDRSISRPNSSEGSRTTEEET